MPIEVNSPVNRRNKGKLLSTERGESPGCRSAPGRRGDSVPNQPAGGTAARTSHGEEPGGTANVTGPED